MKTWLMWAVVIAIGATVVNDVGRFATARYELSNATDEIVQAAAATGKSGSNAAGLAAKAVADQKGVELYGFELVDVRVHVWTRVQLKGTWVWSRFAAWRADQPLETPYMIELDRTAVVQ